jgi:hypothetical protein
LPLLARSVRLEEPDRPTVPPPPLPLRISQRGHPLHPRARQRSQPTPAHPHPRLARLLPRNAEDFAPPH